MPLLKTGIKLPTNDKQWIENFNEIVYSYFAENPWKVDNITDNKKEQIQKYKDFSKQQLKSELNKLKKDRNATPESIRYASKLLRSRIKLPSLESLSKDHDQEISGSLCPLDQISIIWFKRCSILHSFVLEICKEALRRKSILKSWQQAATILIYKKGDKSDPSNFRPIALEPVMLKISTSLRRDRAFKFLHNNKYIETSIQKGLTPGLSGAFEHIANISLIIDDARRRQRSVTITLIDLQNAFGEVHHKLIEIVLKYTTINQMTSSQSSEACIVSFILQLWLTLFLVIILKSDKVFSRVIASARWYLKW